jgi:hypothetical protein
VRDVTGYTDEQRAAVKTAFRQAMRPTSKRTKRTQRHPAEVTSDRLGWHSDRYGSLMSGAERDALALVRHVLEEIADGTRGAS